eukprot:m.23914 g.23914  ORF g.23914 m.23914 type:complete len:215 (+) comp9591_c0_seq1:116-760(+)
MSFGTRMEISSSCELSPVQADNYWRLRYRRDDIRNTSWSEHNYVRSRRASMKATSSVSEPASPTSIFSISSPDDVNTSLPSFFPDIKQLEDSAVATTTSRTTGIRRRNTDPGSPADEHLRARTLRNSRTFERMPSWDRDLFAPLPPVPEKKEAIKLPDCSPRRKSKVGDMELKTDPVKDFQRSQPRRTSLPRLATGSKFNPWSSNSVRLNLSIQ